MADATIVWFRRDLRLADNPALTHAVSQDSAVLPVYLADWEEGDLWRPGAAGRWWLGRSLGSLADSLDALGASLATLAGRPEEVLPALARELGAGSVVWNTLYEPYARALDRRVAEALEREGVAWRSLEAGLLFEPVDALARSGRPFVQFTPYWRHCLSMPEPEPPLAAPGRLAAPAPAAAPTLAGASPNAAPVGPARPAVARPLEGASASEAPGWAPDPGRSDWRPGEAGAAARLERFAECCMTAYQTGRDLLGIEGTSRLSPHLHFGEVGPRQVWQAARRVEEEVVLAGRRGGGRPGAAGEAAAPFLRQLMWREFAHHLLYHFPWMADHPFRPEFAALPWQDDPVGLEAWQWGATGYPLVDASARQLLAEGWVHNRARLVSASFLTKDLLIPWQQGAHWYWDHLVDADLANNTLGWQWTAGSGPDAAPYFRVFNPALQARRFDPDGTYVGRWAGGTAGAPGAPASPGASGSPGASAPGPIVDHAEARARALAAFRGMRDRTAGGHLGSYPLPSDMQV